MIAAAPFPVRSSPRAGEGARRGRDRRRHSAGGFTLLELLVATAIASIVLLVINATFFSALRLHDTTHARIDDDLAVQRALGIVRRDFAGIMLPASATATTNRFAGQLQTTSFSTTSMDGSGAERVGPDIYTSSGRIDGWTQFADVQMVSYYLAPDPNNPVTKDLVRVVTRNLLPVSDTNDEPQTILTGVTAATILFYDGNDWTDAWDTTATSTLPSGIKLSVTLASRGVDAPGNTPGSIDLVVPIIVTTRTSQQAATAAAGQ